MTTLTTEQYEQAQVARLFAPFPHTRLATATDEAALAKLHRDVPMESAPLSLAYDFGRGPAISAREAGRTLVSVFEAQGRLQGTASLSTRKLKLFGTRVPSASVANLRMLPRPDLKVRREWRRFYGALVQAAPSLGAAGRPQFITTAVLQDNALAVKLFTRHLSEVRYLPLQEYHAITALAPLPHARARVPGVTFRFAQAADLERIRVFLAACVDGRGVGEDFTSVGDDELCRRLRDWHGFQVADFVLAESEGGKVLATLAPRFTPHRALTVTRASLSMRAGLALMGMRVPGPMKVLYLTHFELRDGLDPALREALVEALLTFVWRTIGRPNGANGLTFASWPQFGWPQRVPRWVQVKTRGMLYEVAPPDVSASYELHDAARRGPLPLELSIA
jgi:hypothetical protein